LAYVPALTIKGLVNDVFPCTYGYGGLVVSAKLDLVVVSDNVKNKLEMYSIPKLGLGATKTGGGHLVASLGGPGALPPFLFKFAEAGSLPTEVFPSGMMAMPDSQGDVVFLTDAGNGAVHIIDIRHGSHRGYVAAPETIAWPVGIAVSGGGCLVAVSAWSAHHRDDRIVLLRSTCCGDHWDDHVWCQERVVRDVALAWPVGLRFSVDSKSLVVACPSGDRCLTLISVEAGVFEGHLKSGLCNGPTDVQQYDEGCWVIGGVGFWKEDEGEVIQCFHADLFDAVTIAHVPGWGVACRGFHEINFFCRIDEINKASRSEERVAWMAVTTRLSASQLIWK
jgi:hypothetical protein